jgi:Cu(I)/Ag(I) efflux system protein CusF
MATKTASTISQSTRKESYMNRISVLFSAFTLFAGVALTTPMVNAEIQQHAQQTPTALSSGEVNKVDKDAGKITIKHGTLANLNMPAMTMAFKVKDTSMLNQVKPGDKINFTAEKVNGALTVTKLEPLK